MKRLKKVGKLLLTLLIRQGLVDLFSVEVEEVIRNIAPGSKLDDANRCVRKHPFIHHEIDQLNVVPEVCEHGDGVAVLIVR